MKKSIFFAAFLALTASAASAASVGYCSDNAERANLFRVGSTEKQGIALRLDAEKVALLKGHDITGVSVVFGSSRTSGSTATLFVATGIDQEPIYTQTVKINGAVRWLDYTFSTPYTVTGDEPELFIGYTAEISDKASLLVADLAGDMPGCSYVWYDGKWADTYGLHKGNVSFRVNVPSLPDFTDATLKPITANGFYKASTEYNTSAELFNFGNQVISSFDVEVKIGDSDPVKLTYNDVAIQPHENYAFELPAIMTDQNGSLPLSIDIINVNAGDVDTSDNYFNDDIFFYPADMERNLLLEAFTGQACGNCPSGQATINSFLGREHSVPVIEIKHHSGYQPDLMTMNADMHYTWFYGGSSTFAPAFMLNRALISTLSAVPVLNVSEQLLQQSFDYLENQQPYVSFDLKTTYEPNSREVEIDVIVYVHNDLPVEQNTLNVVLVQDGIIGSQSGAGDGYVHNNVFRGAITGNPWGLLLNEEQNKGGHFAQYSAKFELPEAILSDYWNDYKTQFTPEDFQKFYIPAIAEKMRVVAYVSGYDVSALGNNMIYNAVEAPLGESRVQGGMAAVERPTIAPVITDMSIRVEGRRIVVDGDYDSLAVYTADGRRVNAASDLSAGLYIVRAANGKSVATRKVIIK